MTDENYFVTKGKLKNLAEGNRELKKENRKITEENQKLKEENKVLNLQLPLHLTLNHLL